MVSIPFLTYFRSYIVPHQRGDEPNTNQLLDKVPNNSPPRWGNFKPTYLNNNTNYLLDNSLTNSIYCSMILSSIIIYECLERRNRNEFF